MNQRRNTLTPYFSGSGDADTRNGYDNLLGMSNIGRLSLSTARSSCIGATKIPHPGKTVPSTPNAQNGMYRMPLGPARNTLHPKNTPLFNKNAVSQISQDIEKLNIKSDVGAGDDFYSNKDPTFSQHRKSRMSLANARTSSVGSGKNRISFRGGNGSTSSGGISVSGSVGIAKDPRPIKDRYYQSLSIQIILEFLRGTPLEGSISKKTLTSPSSNDFQNVFKYVYGILDPVYTWQGKFEDEVPILIKGLRYPFCNEIGRGHLLAVGTLHSWPLLLALLRWMVELIECCDEVSGEGEQKFGNEDAFGEQLGLLCDESNGYEKMFFDYLTKTYSLFLSGDDNYENIRNDLGKNFEKKKMMIQRDISNLNESINRLERCIDMHEESENHLSDLENKKKTLMEDIEKFKKIMKHKENKKSRSLLSLDESSSIIKNNDEEIERRECEKRETQSLIENQLFSLEDVESMKREKNMYFRTLDNLKRSRDESINLIIEKKNEIKAMEEGIERLIRIFNSLACNVQLIPADAKHAHGNDYEIKLLFNNDNGIVGLNMDLKSNVLPIIQAIREKYQNNCLELSKMGSETTELVNSLNETEADITLENESLKDKVDKLSEHYNVIKRSYHNENKRSTMEMEELEKEMDLIKNEIATNYLLSQQRFQKMTMEHDQWIYRINEEKERILKNISYLFENCLELKNHIKNGVQEFSNWLDNHQNEFNITIKSLTPLS